MTSDPVGPSVVRADAFNRTLAGIFAAERSADGHPSVGDFETLCWPRLASAVAVAWRSAQPVDEAYPNVRGVVVGPILGMFPPARVVVATEAAGPKLPDRLILLGIQFDWDFVWEEHDDPP